MLHLLFSLYTRSDHAGIGAFDMQFVRRLQPNTAGQSDQPCSNQLLAAGSVNAAAFCKTLFIFILMGAQIISKLFFIVMI